MPIVAGKMRHWWNWSANDPKTGRLRTFFTDGMGNIVTRDQLFAWAKATYPYLDLRNFSCEPTSIAPQDKRNLVPKEHYMDDWQLSLYRRLTDQDETLNDAGKLLSPKRSILYGSTIRNPGNRGGGTSNGLQRRVPILQPQ